MQDPWDSPPEEARSVVRGLLEEDIEDPSVAYARRKGDYARKYKSPASRSSPDDIFITNGWVWFVEFKRPGGELTPKQEKEHAKIKAARGEVYVLDNVEAFKAKRDEIAARPPRILDPSIRLLLGYADSR